MANKTFYPLKPGKNPRGGGGNQWIPMTISRQGNYGVQRTFTGKIVRRRPRHYWSENDLRRVTNATIKDIGKTKIPDTWQWWNFLLDTTLHLLNGVGALAGLASNPTFSGLVGILTWLKENQAWADTWQPRITEAWAEFWRVIYGEDKD